MAEGQYRLRRLKAEGEGGWAATALNISSDGVAVLAVDNGAIWVFPLVENVVGYRLAGHHSSAWSLAAQGASLLSGCADGTITLWDTN
jgi:hypothetical protein